MDSKNKTISPSDASNGFQIKSIIKIIIAVTVSLISLAFTILICISMYKNGLTVESILSLLLAFFSIFISIFFYFKADETSNKFYDSSYEFMKEQSVLLGRIEERFGEKFETVLARMDHIDAGQVEKETQLHGVSNEIADIAKKLVQTINTSTQSGNTDVLLAEITKFATELAKKNDEYNQLTESLHEIRQEAQATSHYIKTLQAYLPNSFSDNMLHFFAELSDKDLAYLLRCNGKIQKSNRTFDLARSYGYCNEIGQPSSELKNALDTVRYKSFYTRSFKSK